MSLNARGSTFTTHVPDMIAFDNEKGLNVKLHSKTLSSITAKNDLESKKLAFMMLMEHYINAPQFEQMFRELNSRVVIVIEHSVNTSYN